MSRKTIRCTYWFQSSSGSGLYETLEYEDNTLSCSCPGWCRRTDAQGNRSCKHTRIVSADMGPKLCVRWSGDTTAPQRTTPAKSSAVMPKPGQRKIIV